MTVSEYRRMMGLSEPKKNKYRALPTDGYASRKEARRAEELKVMQQAGLISQLQEQVWYQLLPKQRGEDGKLLEESCSYVADFVYIDNATGKTVVEDTKGFRTKEYIIKRKLMLYQFGIRIKEI